MSTARASAHRSFAATEASYTRTWQSYDASLRQPHGLNDAQTRAYWLSANVLRASVDKTFPGAIAASLASPWGQAVSAGDLPGGKPVYFGSYREVFSRDLYEAVTGLLSVGDVATARDATRFLFDGSSSRPATCRATPCSTARPRPTPAASSSTRRRTRS